eukprot:scaffold20462_cov28-Tisochrysis_lutea.AAC.2
MKGTRPHHEQRTPRLPHRCWRRQPSEPQSSCVGPGRRSRRGWAGPRLLRPGSGHHAPPACPHARAGSPKRPGSGCRRAARAPAAAMRPPQQAGGW